MFFYDQLIAKLPYPTNSHSGQTILVTGSNVGLGLEAARHFVRLNAAKVILAVRSLTAGEKAQRDIETTTGRTNVIEVWHLDLGNHDSIRENVKRVQQLERLDVVVENAGMVTHKWNIIEGDESQVTINTVSTLLHALMVLPKLEETGRKFQVFPHLVFVGSDAHGKTSFPQQKAPHILEELRDERKATPQVLLDRYAVTKLLELLYIRELVRRQKDPKVVINYPNPGLSWSAIMREDDWVTTFVNFMRMFFARTAEQGSRTTLYAASAGIETHGQYLPNCAVRK